MATEFIEANNQEAQKPSEDSITNLIREEDVETGHIHISDGKTSNLTLYP